MLHKWKVEYVDRLGAAKMGCAHTKREAERMAGQALRDGARWATYSRNV